MGADTVKNERNSAENLPKIGKYLAGPQRGSRSLHRSRDGAIDVDALLAGGAVSFDARRRDSAMDLARTRSRNQTTASPAIKQEFSKSKCTNITWNDIMLTMSKYELL